MSKPQNSNKFNFFIPANFEKAKDKAGKGLVKISGVCSSATEDSDGETLFPSGFDYSPFLKSGLLNYNHQSGKTSKAIVGEPTHAEVVNEGKDLYIEGVIYPNEEGTAIVEQQEIFEKYSPNRRFGFSIEGQALERDPFNPKKITKARITGCAITPCPKNPNTLMSIVKGEYAEAFVDDEEEDDEKKKAIDTAAIAPATPESVDGVKKVLSKSEVYESIIDTYGITNFEFVKNIYNFVKSVNVKLFGMENKQEITQDTLNKAYGILDSLAKGETPVDGVKDAGSEAGNTEAGAAAPGSGDAIQKSEDAEALEFAKSMYAEGKTKDECVEGMIRKGYSLTVSQGAVESVIAEANAKKEGGDVTQQGTSIMKSEDVQSITDSIVKSLENTMGVKLAPVQEQIVKGFGAVNDLFQAQNQENNFLKSKLDEVSGRLTQLENTPMPRKSLTNANAIDKFQKSEGGENGAGAVRTVSVSNKIQKSMLADEMFDAFTKSQNPELGDAITTFESANFLSPAMCKQFNVQLVP